MEAMFDALKSEAMLNRVGSAIACQECNLDRIHWDHHEGWAKQYYNRMAAAALLEVVAALSEQGL